MVVTASIRVLESVYPLRERMGKENDGSGEGPREGRRCHRRQGYRLIFTGGPVSAGPPALKV